jgi:hypothetical protein
MAECNHVWKLRASGLKEGCELCGAGRLVDPSRCDHDYQPRPDGNKEACTKCGTARAILAVQDVKKPQKAKTL